MVYRVVPRGEIGLPSPPSNMSGSPRPQLAKGREGMAVHYVGAGRFLNRDAVEAVLAIESFARSPQKATPFEYNYMVSQAEDLLIHEYAGRFRAAHSRNNNSSFFGVCLLNGADEGPTDQQIDKVRWLRDQLISDGWIRRDGLLLPHRQMPGQVGATACPGDRVMARWAEFEQPWAADTSPAAEVPPAPPEPEPPEPEPPEPEPPDADGFGHHLVREQETSRSIALLHLGSEERAAEIDEANGGQPLSPGQRCNVPGAQGVWVVVRPGWGPFTCIRAAGAVPSAAEVERFWRWNGGDAEAGERGPLLADEEVWVETAAPNTVVPAPR